MIVINGKQYSEDRVNILMNAEDYMHLLDTLEKMIQCDCQKFDELELITMGSLTRNLKQKLDEECYEGLTVSRRF